MNHANCESYSVEDKAVALHYIIKTLKKTRERGLPFHLLLEVILEAFRLANKWGAFAGTRWSALPYRALEQFHHFADIMSYADDRGFLGPRSYDVSWNNTINEAANQLIMLLGQESAVSHTD